MDSRIRWDLIILALLMLGMFWVRAELATGSEAYSYDSYLSLRQVDSILETGKPLRYDPLSITGNERVGSPLFDYVVALGMLVTPIAAKVLPNLFMVLLALPVFFLARSLTRSSGAAILSAVLALTAPFVFSGYIITVSAVPLAVLAFLSILAMLMDPDAHLPWIIGFSLLLTFLHPLSFLLAASLLAVMLLLRIEGFGVDRKVHELLLFTLLLVCWFHILTYKKALFQDGLGIVWQNLPQEYATRLFQSLDGLTLLYGVGVLSVLFGMIGAYHALFETRLRESFPVIAASIMVAIALTFRLLELRVGLILLSCLLAILASRGLVVSMTYLGKTKAPWTRYPLMILIALLFLFTSILPALTNAHASLTDAPNVEDIAGMRALASSVPEDAIILTTVEEGGAVQYYAHKRTVTDADFLLVRDGDIIVEDVASAFTARFTTTVVNIAEKRDFTHILFTDHARQRFMRDGILVDDPRCLPHEDISTTVRIYTIACGGV